MCRYTPLHFTPKVTVYFADFDAAVEAAAAQGRAYAAALRGAK
jgi:hypothetical protein